MDGKICYLNTDLVLASEHDLTALARAFEAGGSFSLQTALGDDGLWHAAFETNESHEEPEANIAEMLAVVDSLSPPLRKDWENCTLREFNIGFDCGDEPWAFNQSLSSGLLSRISAASASITLTMYPDRE